MNLHLKSKKNEVFGDDLHFLKLKTRPRIQTRGSIKSVDLFCGCGGMSLGLECAALTHGYEVQTQLAVDFYQPALNVFSKNFEPNEALNIDITQIFPASMTTKETVFESRIRKDTSAIDFLMGGPPCQGHSDLNNFTRREDPKNRLMLVMSRAARTLNPKTIVIENVVGAKNDKGRIVDHTTTELNRMGYFVDVGIMEFAEIGVAQKRRRLIILASMERKTTIKEIQENFCTSLRGVGWAFQGIRHSEAIFDQPSQPNIVSQGRIDYLHDFDVYELPNSLRPPCHRDKSHSYDTVYGRLRPSEPSQTITSGFYHMSMGRYVHPSHRRTLTAHEAARLQFFPDYFDFSDVKKRGELAEIIGNAVPSKGIFSIASHILSMRNQK